MPPDARRLVTGSFVALFVLTALGFGLTAAGHVAYLERERITGDVTEYATVEGERRAIDVTVRVENPTPRAVTVTRPEGFEAFLAGQRIAEGETATHRPGVVPARGAITRTVRLVPTATGRERWPGVRQAVRERTLTVAGRFSGRIGEKRIVVAVPEGGPDDG